MWPITKLNTITDKLKFLVSLSLSPATLIQYMKHPLTCTTELRVEPSQHATGCGHQTSTISGGSRGPRGEGGRSSQPWRPDTSWCGGGSSSVASTIATSPTGSRTLQTIQKILIQADKYKKPIRKKKLKPAQKSWHQPRKGRYNE